MNCKNCFIKDGMGKRSPTTNCSHVKYTALSAPLMVGTIVLSDTSSLMTVGTSLKDLNSSIDIAETRLLIMGVSLRVPLLCPT